jgi:hypothetical protein
MALALTTLTNRLLDDVPRVAGVPTDDQLLDAVRDAVSAYSMLVPAPRIVPLTITAGTATYAAPADILRIRRLYGMGVEQGPLITPQGILPAPTDGWPNERVTVAAGIITITPTPAHSSVRDLDYDAIHLLDETTETYPTLSDTDGRVIILKARANVLRLQATATARQAWSYQQGDERVSKEKLSAALRDQADDLEQQFSAAVQQLQAAQSSDGRAIPYGSRARIAPTGRQV